MDVSDAGSSPEAPLVRGAVCCQAFSVWSVGEFSVFLGLAFRCLGDCYQALVPVEGSAGMENGRLVDSWIRGFGAKGPGVVLTACLKWFRGSLVRELQSVRLRSCS